MFENSLCPASIYEFKYSFNGFYVLGTVLGARAAGKDGQALVGVSEGPGGDVLIGVRAGTPHPTQFSHRSSLCLTLPVMVVNWEDFHPSIYLIENSVLGYILEFMTFKFYSLLQAYFRILARLDAF